MPLQQMLRHHLVDLRLRERLQPDVDFSQDSLTFFYYPKHPGFFRAEENLFEVLDACFKGAVAVDGHEPVTGSEVGSCSRAVVDDRLDGDAGIELFDHRAEVAPAARKLPDDPLALTRVGGTHLPILGVGRGNEKQCCNEKLRKSDGHC